tara:strand:+ start:609 stop:1211 length:603 start_codon:yes stop_codon:yes gene_type:complete
MNEYLSKLLYTHDNVLPKYLCEDIINLFENNKDLQFPGRVGNNDNDNIDTIDIDYRKVTALVIPKMTREWSYLESLLYFTVNRHFDNYLKNVKQIEYVKNQAFILPEFNIIKYEKKSDYYKSHNDFMIDHDTNAFRYATFIIYLNTVVKGGNTIFWDIHKEKPKTGKIMFFPSNWTFQHKGEMPLSDDKYIIVGWISLKY